jgi:D-alanine-D-alanine ligase-like ATP-grasp enzyme
VSQASHIDTARSELRKLWGRARFYSNVPEMMTLLAFRKLRAKYYRELWQAAAANIEADFAELSGGQSMISSDGLATVVNGYETMLDGQVMAKLVSDKLATYRLMQLAGVEVAPHQAFSARDIAPACAFLNALDGPAVVKPSGGTGAGRGVTTGIGTPRQLKRAASYAARFGGDLLIEKQIAGRSFRLLYLGGRFIDAVRRDPPCLVGDGRSTVRKLVKAENRARLDDAPVTALSPLRFDPDMERTLAAQGLAPGSRPEEGRRFRIKTVANENASHENHVVRDDVHPATVAMGRELVNRLGLRFAGLDVIAMDISAPLGPGNGVFGEINTTPGLHHHELVSDPARRARVAELALIHMFSAREGVMRLGPAAAEGHYRSRSRISERADHGA